jgi:trans-2,3-dihydro-3-hydroxyanthranilate isomerase
MSRPCHVLRVFTRGDEGGNHLGVVNDVTGLDTAVMHQIATELGFSETIFIDWRAGGTPRVRIFTPVAELPFAGHPLVGAAWSLNRMGPGGVDRLVCGIGEVRVRLDGDVTWIDTDFDPAAAHRSDEVALAAEARLPVPVAAWRVAMPKDYLLLELGAESDVAEADPDMAVLARHFGTMIYARRGSRVRTRFFTPGSGIDEDPATGSAAVALAIALTAGGEPAGALEIDQGAEIGHPSHIALRWGDGVASIGGTVRRDEVRHLEV